MRWSAIIPFFATMSASTAFAQTDAHQLVGRELGIAWAIPFAGLLLSIALMPLIAPRFWEHNFGKVSAFWAAAFLLPCAIVFGPYTAASATAHTLAIEYLPFILSFSHCS